MNPVDQPVVWAVVWSAVAAATWCPRPPVRRVGEPNADTVLSPPPRTTAGERSGGVAPRRRRRDRAGRVTEALELAHWCEHVSRAVRSGSTLTAALDDVPPPPAVAAELGDLAAALRRGRAIDTSAASGHPDLALVIGVVAACHEHGGAAAEPLDRAASVLRGRAAETAERQTQSAQARLSARVMTVLPIAMLTVLLASSASVRHVVTTPAGAIAVGTGAFANVAGWWWLRHLVDGSSR